MEVIIDQPDGSQRRDPLDIDAQAWNPDAAARRAKAARLETMTVVPDAPAHPSNPEWEPTPEDQAMAAHGAAITEVVKEMHQAATGIELTRRHYGFVQSRCREGFPDAMDVRYLLSLVDMADGMLQILAQPHVLGLWEKALHE
jgi:hypothetical protein